MEVNFWNERKSLCQDRIQDSLTKNKIIRIIIDRMIKDDHTHHLSLQRPSNSMRVKMHLSSNQYLGLIHLLFLHMLRICLQEINKMKTLEWKKWIQTLVIEIMLAFPDIANSSNIMVQWWQVGVAHHPFLRVATDRCPSQTLIIHFTDMKNSQ